MDLQFIRWERKKRRGGEGRVGGGGGGAFDRDGRGAHSNLEASSFSEQTKKKNPPIYQLAESKTSFAELDFVSTSVVPNCGAVRNQRRTRQQKLGLKPTTLSDGVTELIFLLSQFCLNV